MVYNNPVSYGVDITPEMFAELADEPKLVAIKESSENVRRITDLRNVCGRPLHAVLRRRRPRARKPAARRARLGLGPGQRVPRREPAALGPGRRRPLGRGRARSTAGTRRCCTSTPTSSSSSTSSWPCRNAGSASEIVRAPSPAAGGRGARAASSASSAGDRRATQLGTVEPPSEIESREHNHDHEPLDRPTRRDVSR